MKINGININDIAEKLNEMADAIAALINVTDLGGRSPEIRFDSSLSELIGVQGVFFEHKKGNVIGIYAGGTDISEIVSRGTWNAAEEQAEELYIEEIKNK